MTVRDFIKTAIDSNSLTAWDALCVDKLESPLDFRYGAVWIRTERNTVLHLDLATPFLDPATWRGVVRAKRGVNAFDDEPFDRHVAFLTELHAGKTLEEALAAATCDL